MKIIHDRIGFIIAASTFLFSLILFYDQTGDPFGSFTAALLATGLVWCSYIILRWFFLAAR